MKKRAKRKPLSPAQWRWVASGATVLLLAIEWVVIHSTTFANCIQEQAGQRTAQQQQFPPYALALAHDFGFWLACNTHVLYEARDVFTVFSTVLLAGFTYKIWTGADDTLDHLQESSRSELRAYLSVIGVSVGQFKTAPAFVGLNIFNHGLTPAHNVTMSSGVNDHDVPLGEAFTIPTDIDFQDLKIVIPPRHGFNCGAKAARLFNAVDIAAVTGGAKRRIYCYGIVKYTDVFKQSCETQFCFSIAPSDQLTLLSNGHEGKPYFELTQNQNKAT